MDLKKFIKTTRLKPLDGVIVCFLILVSFVPLLLFSLNQKDSGKNITYEAILSVDGKKIKAFDLKKNDTYRYQDEDGDFNLIEVKNGKIRVKDTNCGDLICVRRGWIEKAGETIVCLPHKLLIEIKASDGSEEGNVIY